MPTLAPPTIRLGEFLSEYGGENGYEYLVGEVVFKGRTTRRHNLLQRVLEGLSRASGYRGASAELELYVDPGWRQLSSRDYWEWGRRGTRIVRED